MDGAPACPFVAFGDDREGRSTSPDHRHRCFAESPPAPRALAHQEAYCLSSAFPVCPTFQDWARREAAHARGDGERPETAPTAAPILAAAAAMDGGRTDAPEPAGSGSAGVATGRRTRRTRRPRWPRQLRAIPRVGRMRRATGPPRRRGRRAPAGPPPGRAGRLPVGSVEAVRPGPLAAPRARDSRGVPRIAWRVVRPPRRAPAGQRVPDSLPVWRHRALPPGPRPRPARRLPPPMTNWRVSSVAARPILRRFGPRAIPVRRPPARVVDRR